MSGQQEPWSELDRFDRLDSRDRTLDLSGLISRLNNGSISNGDNSRGNGRREDNGLGVGDNARAGNSGVNGNGDTVPYMRPPQPAQAEPDVAAPPQLPQLPPADAVRVARTAVTVRPEPSGANGHGAIAAYTAYAAHGTRAAPRHSRESAPETQSESDARADPQPLQEPSVPPDAVMPAARPERPAPGSLADLRQRLERLPYGHPSSPYHVDGERKPPPHRLKHLELAPPTPNRVTPAHSQPPIVDDDPIAVAATPDAPIAATTPVAPTAAVNPGAESRSADLTQDQVRIANDAYDRFRAAEGKNLFGSYGSTGLTSVLRGVETILEYGELAPDTEQNALLEPNAFKARFAAMLARYPDRSAELLARRIPGAISYSFIFDAERYSAGIWMAQDALTATGFQLLARRNDWNNTANRCVATMWHDPTSGLPFEVQFHTTASLEAQQLARSSATLISDPRIPSAEAANLRSDLAVAWAALHAPPGHSQIGEYRREGGQPPESPPPASAASG
jgi:hypothetical protein